MPSIDAASEYAAPSPRDRGALCLDAGEIRVCFGDRGPFWFARPLPLGPAPPQGFRCGGTRSARRCEDRAKNGGPFLCNGARCVQTRPRMPDDGEWECVEMDAAVFCRSRGDAAGIASGPMDSAWVCGTRRGEGRGERVCVDFDADRPDAMGSFSCRFEHPHGNAERVCTRAHGPMLGSVCGAGRACPSGMACIEGRCLPPRPLPSCWYDKDCGSGITCRWGTCAD